MNESRPRRRRLPPLSPTTTLISTPPHTHTQVYESHARVALEAGDLGEFLICAARLDDLRALGCVRYRRMLLGRLHGAITYI